ncbi:MAG: DMT family transporter [Gammaproteobacteria bacterium]|nr:DMT family transporter [Gammaproteobacteria bacterium]NIR82967.1 DMT family transporter [Gammaproteobacteria bacterium]NIR90332.1 DMT family transporter [Gammaproteobacteria bacterium]NIU04113.1 DMT family transporter [Gammaproteobacteria bacterium]NIV51409.1 EamA family transporter [Gammaproteobacteria bacterium]
MTGRPRTDLLPSLGVAVSGVLWGLFWMPFRALGEAGFAGGWASLVFYLGSTLVLLPWAVARGRRLRAAGIGLLLTGAIAGAAFSLYATALLLTEVVRVLLLFYLTPVWGTVLGRVLLGERMTWHRGVALVFGMVGLIVILGVEGGFPMPRNAGDWMALLAGVAWAYGSLRIYIQPEVEAHETTFAFFAGGTLVTATVAWLPLEANAAAPTLATLGTAWPWLLLLVAVFGVPPVLMTLWGAARLTPGRVGILLMGEVAVGIVSAALWAGEPFGLRETLGAALIVGAAVVEIMQRQAAVTSGWEAP